MQDITIIASAVVSNVRRGKLAVYGVLFLRSPIFVSGCLLPLLGAVGGKTIHTTLGHA